jgi:hypothetical protein
VAKLFNKILCPIDFDDNSMAALDLAAKSPCEAKRRYVSCTWSRIPVQAQLMPLPLEPYEVWEKEAHTKLDQIARDRIPANVHAKS